MVVPVILGGEVEYGLPGPVAEPQHGLRLPARRPGDLPQQPRSAYPGQISGGGGIQVHPRSRVLLEVGGRHLRAHLSLHRPAHDGRLVLAGGDEHHLPRRHDAGHPHGHRLQRHVLLAEEVRRGIRPGDGVQIDHPGTGLPAGTGLVESHVAAPADSQDLQVDPPGGSDGLLVGPAMCLQLRRGKVAPGQVDLVPGDVHVVEEVLPHVAVVALRVVGREAQVLVEVEGGDPGEVQSFLPVHPHERVVQAQGSGARGETEDEIGLPPQSARHEPRRPAAQVLVVGGDDDKHDAPPILAQAHDERHDHGPCPVNGRG
jgi:hypothetical protein